MVASARQLAWNCDRVTVLVALELVFSSTDCRLLVPSETPSGRPMCLFHLFSQRAVMEAGDIIVVNSEDADLSITGVDGEIFYFTGMVPKTVWRLLRIEEAVGFSTVITIEASAKSLVAKLHEHMIANWREMGLSCQHIRQHIGSRTKLNRLLGRRGLGIWWIVARQAVRIYLRSSAGWAYAARAIEDLLPSAFPHRKVISLSHHNSCNPGVNATVMTHFRCCVR